jgi:hypothetical protein
VLPVQIADNPGIPVIGNQRKLFTQVHFQHAFSLKPRDYASMKSRK